jgi:hypothetical protein
VWLIGVLSLYTVAGQYLFPVTVRVSKIAQVFFKASGIFQSSSGY